MGKPNPPIRHSIRSDRARRPDMTGSMQLTGPPATLSPRYADSTSKRRCAIAASMKQYLFATVAHAFQAMQTMLFWFYFYVVLLCLARFHEPPFERLCMLVERRGPTIDLEKEWGELLAYQRQRRELEQFFGTAMLAAAPALLLVAFGASSTPVHAAIPTLGIICILCSAVGLGFSAFYKSRLEHVERDKRGSAWLMDGISTASSRWSCLPMLLAPPLAWIAWAVFALLGLLLSFFWTPVGAAHAPERATGWDVGGSLGPSLAGTTVIAIGITHLIVVVPRFRRIGHRQPLPSDVAV